MEVRAKIGMSRFIIVVLGAWLAVGGCGAPLMSCPLLEESAQHHDCCPHGEPSAALTECPYFVAVQVVSVDGAAPAITDLAPMLAVLSAFAPVFHSPLQDQHNLYLGIRVLRI
jgi:hypothetical protein